MRASAVKKTQKRKVKASVETCQWGYSWTVEHCNRPVYYNLLYSNGDSERLCKYHGDSINIAVKGVTLLKVGAK